MLPHALHKELLELNDRLDGTPPNFLHLHTHQSNLVYLHDNLEHHTYVICTMLKNRIQAFFKDRIFDIRILHHVSKDQKKRLNVHPLSLFILRKEHINVIILLDFLEQSNLFLTAGPNPLKLDRLGQHLRNLPDEQILIQLFRIDRLILQQQPLLILIRLVPEMQIHKARQDDQKDEKCAKKDGDLVLSVEKEAGQSDGYILTAVGTIRVAILSEVFGCFFVGQDLQSCKPIDITICLNQFRRQLIRHLHCTLLSV